MRTTDKLHKVTWVGSGHELRKEEVAAGCSVASEEHLQHRISPGRLAFGFAPFLTSTPWGACAPLPAIKSFRPACSGLSFLPQTWPAARRSQWCHWGHSLQAGQLRKRRAPELQSPHNRTTTTLEKRGTALSVGTRSRVCISRLKGWAPWETINSAKRASTSRVSRCLQWSQMRARHWHAGRRAPR